jgi:hypothetical protein
VNCFEAEKNRQKDYISTIVEMPSDEKMMSVMLTTGSLGNARGKKDPQGDSNARSSSDD